MPLVENLNSIDFISRVKEKMLELEDSRLDKIKKWLRRSTSSYERYGSNKRNSLSKVL